MTLTKYLGAIAIMFLCYLGFVWATGPASGLAVGEPTLSFTVMDVTGAYKGKRICYVCEFQDAPNILSFFQTTGDETAKLIVRLNELYQNNKDKDLKAVAVIVAGTDATPWLEDLQRTSAIEIPMVVLRKGPKDVAVRMYHLDPEVKNTFLVAVNRTVKANLTDIQPGSFEQVADAATRMLAGK
jgi:hypothetical protein